MTTTLEELKMFHNNVMVIMENRIMMLTGCDRLAANLAANEVLNLDRDAERLLSNKEDEEKDCCTCRYYSDSCDLYGSGCKTEMMECYEKR